MPNIERLKSITKGYSVIFSSSVFIPLLVITFLAFLNSIWNRYIYIDDVFFGEQAYWLAKQGVVKIPSMLDFLGCENQLFSYHKLNIFIGAGIIKIFGWSITPLRVIGILFFAALVWMVIKYCKQFPLVYTKLHIIIVVFILFCNPLTVLYIFTYRPEIWVAFFGFVSYFFIHETIKTGGYYKLPIYAGIFAGLAFLTHLNGLIFPIAGFFSLLLFKRYKELLWFILSGGLVGLFYFWDLWQGNNFELWLYQLKNWPDNNATNYLSHNIWHLIGNLFIKLSNEHQRFFWSSNVWGTSALFLLSFFVNFKFFYRQHRLLFIYTIVLILALNIAGGPVAERYLIYFFPFFAIIISLAVVRLVDLDHHYILKVGFILFFFLQFVFVGKMFYEISQLSGNFVEMHKKILSKIPEKSALVLAPYEFMFNGLATNKMASYKGFEYFETRMKRHLSQDEFFRRADSLDIKYVVLPENVLNYRDKGIPCLNGGKIEENRYYSEFYRDSSTLILQKKTKF